MESQTKPAFQSQREEIRTLGALIKWMEQYKILCMLFKRQWGSLDEGKFNDFVVRIGRALTQETGVGLGGWPENQSRQEQVEATQLSPRSLAELNLLFDWLAGEEAFRR